MSNDVFQRLSDSLSDRYRIDREIGAGGMATVFLAHDLRHDHDVAIKVLHPDFGAALGGDRFLSEIRTTARLQHPHILPLLYSGGADGLLYYVMPLVTGETLRTQLDREKQLPSTTPSASRARSPMRSPMRTTSGSSTATSSRRTSSSRADTRASRTSASRSPSSRPADNA